MMNTAVKSSIKYLQTEFNSPLKRPYTGQEWCHMPGIPSTQEVEIRSIVV
jgi:hypothetical protein